MRYKKAFTLTEILIVVFILAILSSVGIVSWDRMIEKARVSICQQNQAIILNGIIFYIEDNEAVPTTLSSLYPEYTDIALAKLREKHPVSAAKRKILLALLYINDGRPAWAQSFRYYIGGNRSVLHCPSDPNQNNMSYTLSDVFDGSHAPQDVLEALEYQEFAAIWDGPSYPYETAGSALHIANISRGNVNMRHGARFFSRIRKAAITSSRGGRYIAKETSTSGAKKHGYIELEKDGEYVSGGLEALMRRDG
jgi:prepilin-type N-terminal cleavage/methylation domain-containing protein